MTARIRLNLFVFGSFEREDCSARSGRERSPVVDSRLLCSGPLRVFDTRHGAGALPREVKAGTSGCSQDPGFC